MLLKQWMLHTAATTHSFMFHLPPSLPCTHPLQNRSWLGSLALQFLPNFLSFFSMYVAAPFLLARLARFEGHLTLAGRQSANFVKLLVFFLVNLFLFKVCCARLYVLLERCASCFALPMPVLVGTHATPSNVLVLLLALRRS